MIGRLQQTAGRATRATKRIVAPGSLDALARARAGRRDSSAEFVRTQLAGIPTFSGADALLAHCLNIRPPSGSILEFGVYKGRSLNRMARSVGPGELVTGFDSFAGLPEDWGSRLPKGKYRLSRAPRVEASVRLVVGAFEETVPKYVESHPEPAALVHIDSDLYSSAKAVLDRIPMQRGTLIVFDEFYNYPGWEDGEAKAWRECAAARHLDHGFIGYCPRSEQVAVRICGP